MKLRQHGHLRRGGGAYPRRLSIAGSAAPALPLNLGLLKIVHGAVIPGQPRNALSRLPSLVPLGSSGAG